MWTSRAWWRRKKSGFSQPVFRPKQAENRSLTPFSFRRRGSALLAVLWLSAVLAAIAFSLASTVRGEAERASTGVDSTRAYYLATGAIQRSILYVLWGRNPAGVFEFPSGEAYVELIPEAAKFNINGIPPQDLFRLLENLGVEPERAQMITGAVVDWRSPAQ